MTPSNSDWLISAPNFKNWWQDLDNESSWCRTPVKIILLQSHLQIFVFCPKMSWHTLKHQGKDTRAAKTTRATPSKVNSQLPCEEEETHLNDLHDCFHFNFQSDQLIKWTAYSLSGLQWKSHSSCNAVCFQSLWKDWKGLKFMERRPFLIIKLTNVILEKVPYQKKTCDY